MPKNNAFWREVIDYLPNLILIFRIDKEENAQLIFCNRRIQEELGYTAREFVLASESEGVVHREIDSLVEEVARRSHDVEDIDPQPCMLTSKRGESKQYNIDFRLFKTKAGGSNLIAVELLLSGEKPANAPNHKTEKQMKGSTVADQLFVCESEVMRSVVKTLDQLENGRRHLLLCGEYGTGKRTLVERMIRHYEAEQMNLVREVGGESKNASSAVNWKELKSVSRNLVLQLIHLSELSSDQQQALLDLVKTRDNGGMFTRIIATSRYSPEELVENGNVDAELYYYLAFQSVRIPPLRHRIADIKAAARCYIEKAVQALNLSLKNVEGRELRKLEDQKWEGNFPELFKVLRRSLLESDKEKFEVRLKERQKFQLFPEQRISEDEVLGFDEMNKRYLERILQLTDGKIYGDDGAASLLSLKPTTLQSKLKRLGIK